MYETVDPKVFATRMGSRIYGVRTVRGLTMQQLADRMGVSLSTVQAWENGTRRILSERLPALCYYLRVPPTYLLGMPPETPADRKEI